MQKNITVKIDLGDRHHTTCVLDEAGEIVAGLRLVGGLISIVETVGKPKP